ncbi:MAG: hypothetical protein ABEH66_07400 [Halobacteriales archaeon]
MQVTKHDATMLMYNFAVVLSGSYAVWNFPVDSRTFLFGLSFFFGIVWTVYFKFAMVDRFVDHPTLVDAIRNDEPEG